MLGLKLINVLKSGPGALTVQNVTYVEHKYISLLQVTHRPFFSTEKYMQ